MSKRDDRQMKPSQGSKQKMVRCTACRPNHDVPVNEIAHHRQEVQRLGARRAGSRA